MLFGKSHDDTDIGPGMYDLKMEGGQAYTFTKEGRMRGDKSFSPGPGAYNAKHSLIKD